MQVTINGEAAALEGPVTVAGLLVHLGLNGAKVAIERNRCVVPRSQWGQEQLAHGDVIEIVHFIGGG